jgi:hypothetical protein
VLSLWPVPVWAELMNKNPAHAPLPSATDRYNDPVLSNMDGVDLLALVPVQLPNEFFDPNLFITINDPPPVLWT